MRTTRLHVTLRDVTPSVVRVVDVPATATLAEVHQLLQSAIGWTDSHLHEFAADDTRFGPPDQDLGTLDDATAHLSDLPATFVYLYDYGDGWTHDTRVLGPGDDHPGCSYGEGTCPPEDSGGPHGHAELLAVLADPSHPDHARMRDWAGPQRDFDRDATDRLVRRTAGTVPTAVRLLLDLARSGITLTTGGRLPRAVVRQVQQHRPAWSWSEKPAHTEDDLPPLAALHDLLRDTGLLQLRKGTLHTLRAATDDQQVLRRLRDWFTEDRFTGLLTQPGTRPARRPRPGHDRRPRNPHPADPRTRLDQRRTPAHRERPHPEHPPAQLRLARTRPRRQRAHADRPRPVGARAAAQRDPPCASVER